MQKFKRLEIVAGTVNENQMRRIRKMVRNTERPGNLQRNVKKKMYFCCEK